MAQVVRVKLSSIDIERLNEITDSIREISKKAGVNAKGPIPLPTKRLKVTTRKSTCGDGAATFDNFEMRIHKRVIDLPSNDKILHSVMRLPIPKSVNIKIEMKG
jgi:small subunit ribosomal protein S10